jgi:ABC-type enterochelin transport system permease subunit
MSTLAYATLTTRREQAPPGESTSKSPPGVTSFIDAVAALVPAEVLTLHAVILSITTKTMQDASGNSITEITEPGTLVWAFIGLLLLSVVLYVVPRISKKDWWDCLRAIIPPAAFVAWTMLQRATAFDAVWPELGEAPRTVIALFGAVVLGVMATLLARKADNKKPS